jgi:signal transduction histidine kinase
MATKSERESLTVPRIAGQWLSGERLETVRRVLIALSVVVAVLFVIGCGYFYDQLRLPCEGPDCTPLQRPTYPGTSQEFYARWTIGRESVAFLAFCLLAAVLYWKAPWQPMALFGAITMVLFGGAVIPDAMTAVVQSDSLLRYPAMVFELTGSLAIIAFILLFPDGRFVPRWMHWLLVPLIPLSVIGYLVSADHFFSVDGNGSLLVWIGYLALGAAMQVVRYRGSTNEIERQQLKWVGLGLATATAGLLVGAVLRPIVPDSVIENRRTFALVGTTLTTSFLLLIPISMALALLRYRLWDVDRIARRALLSGALIAAITGIYAAIVLVASALIPAGSNRLWPLVAAVAVALLLQPVRGRLERSVNRLFYGQRDDPYAVVSELGERLEGSLSQETALPTIVETIATALRLPYVAIALERDGTFALSAQHGAPGVDPIVFPLTNGPETIGQLLVSPRGEGEGFSVADRRLLADVSRQAGAAVQAVRLTNELEEANRHLLSVRGEERQRLRRDLHDGLGPLLASQMLILDSARKLMPSDPALSGNLLDQLQRSIQTSVEDVRRLVNSLRPAALDELGLVAAIQDGTADLQRAGVRVTIDAPAELGPLSAATETTAYRIVMEGVTNVARHARAETCRVSLAVVPEQLLRIVIEDNGGGIPESASAGVGLGSMRERARELGGAVTIDSQLGEGTTIVATLPIQGRPV